MTRNRFTLLLLMAGPLASCSRAPDFKLPDVRVPVSYKEQPSGAEAATPSGTWEPAKSLDKEDRGQWWKIFDDASLNDLEQQAQDANPSLQAAAARVGEARGVARANSFSLLPDIDIGANATRAQPANASLVAFGQSGGRLKPYTLYAAQGTASYEADLFGRVRDAEKAYRYDADAQEADYRSVLLALQADVAQQYYALRTLDSERQLLRDTVKMREEANRIMQKQYDVGESGEQDLARTQSELAGSQADLAALDRQRATAEHAMAVLLGKTPSEYMFAESPLSGAPPEIPAGLPSQLLERRPDIAAAQSAMAAANARIGVARAAFFPSLILTASGGYESTQLSKLFLWPSRTWALGQLSGMALTMPVFDNGHNLGQLDVAHAQYDEAVANYRQQVLVAFRDVEDNLSDQRLLAGQSQSQDTAAASALRTTELTQKQYQVGEVNYFEVVTAEQNSLAAERAALQLRGQRFVTTINLIRALGGGFDQPAAGDLAPAESTATAAAASTPEKPAIDLKNIHPLLPLSSFGITP